MRDNPWTEAVVAELRRLHAARMSASQIADALGGGITRNAVIGKLTRLGLTGGGQLTSRQRSAVATRTIARARREGASPRLGLALQTKRRTALALTADDWTPKPDTAPERLVPLLDWPEDACKAPYGSDPVLFGCCRPRVPGLSYCAHHVALFYAPPSVRKPSDWLDNEKASDFAAEASRQSDGVEMPKNEETACKPARTVFIGHPDMEVAE